MRARPSGSSSPVFMRSRFSLGIALLFLCGCAALAAPAELQQPLMVRPQITPVSDVKIPVAGFSADVTSGPVPLTVRFSDESLNTPTSWSWDLNGDGKSDSSLSNPEYTYSVPGSYTVRLTVTNRAGTDTMENQGFIIAGTAVPGPEAGFSAYPDRGTAPLTVRFSDESRNDPTAWWWDFDNDGLTDSREREPVWTYKKPGIYTVRLSVISDAGKDEVIKKGIITVLEPVIPDITPATTTTTTGLAPVTDTPSPPAKPGEPPGFPWLLAVIALALLLCGGYLWMRGRSPRQVTEEGHDLHFELTGGIDYGGEEGEDLLEALREALEEHAEDEDGRP